MALRNLGGKTTSCTDHTNREQEQHTTRNSRVAIAGQLRRTQQANTADSDHDGFQTQGSRNGIHRSYGRRSGRPGRRPGLSVPRRRKRGRPLLSHYPVQREDSHGTYGAILALFHACSSLTVPRSLASSTPANIQPTTGWRRSRSSTTLTSAPWMCSSLASKFPVALSRPTKPRVYRWDVRSCPSFVCASAPAAASRARMQIQNIMSMPAAPAPGFFPPRRQALFHAPPRARTA